MLRSELDGQLKEGTLKVGEYPPECFPGEAMVQSERSGRCRIADLLVGDRILSAQGEIAKSRKCLIKMIASVTLPKGDLEWEGSFKRQLTHLISKGNLRMKLKKVT